MPVANWFLLQIETGYRVTAVTVRKLEFEPDTFAFADKVGWVWSGFMTNGVGQG